MKDKSQWLTFRMAHKKTLREQRAKNQPTIHVDRRQPEQKSIKRRIMKEHTEPDLF